MLAGRPELKALAAPGIIGRRLVPHCVELNRQLAVPLERDRQLSTDRHGRLRAHVSFVRTCAQLRETSTGGIKTDGPNSTSSGRQKAETYDTARSNTDREPEKPERITD